MIGKFRMMAAAAALALGMGLAGPALAQNNFTVSPGGLGEPNGNFTADQFNANSSSRVLLNNTNGTFTEFGFIQLGQFTLGGPIVVGTGLNSNYGIYATFTAAGNFNVSGGTTINGTFSSFQMNLFFDPNLDTGLGAYATSLNAAGSNPVNNTGLITGTGDDFLLGTGVIPNLSGEASATALINLLATTNGGAATGSFGGTLGFTLTAQGQSYFIDPNPFYNLILAQQTPISGGIRYLSGTDFSNSASAEIALSTGGPGRFDVPEPATFALFGMGVLGLALVLRRRRGSVEA